MLSIAKAQSADAAACSVSAGKKLEENGKAGGVFSVVCTDAGGNVKWTSENHNLVVNQGLQYMNQQFFAGTTYTATWYLGLYGAAATNNPAATDTAALHPGWTEITGYSSATRPVVTFGTATTADPSVITNSAVPTSFSINATNVIGGAFVISNSTKGGTAGVLFSAADFAFPGDRNVVSGDTLTVTYTFSLDAA
jgi:hypothetical protein